MRKVNLVTAVAIAAAALVVGALFGQPDSGRAAGTGPVNTAPPTIWGAAQDGQTLMASNGSWSGSPTSYAYAWSRCDKSGNSCTAIGGATAADYKAATADVGNTVRITVTATNADGSSQATSAPSAVVSKATAPTNTAAPAISGALQVGSKLTASTGTWTGSPASYAFAWSRCGPKGNGCATIDGATGNTYTLTQAAAGRTLRISVVATHGGDSTQVTSAATAAVPTSNGCPAGTGAIQIGDLTPPARLMIAKTSISPRLVTLGTHAIQLHFTVTACNGRPVQGATVYASPIPFSQFDGKTGTTGPAGTVTVTETRQKGFPARSHRQELLAVFVRAWKQGEPILGGVSTRRTVAFPVSLP